MGRFNRRLYGGTLIGVAVVGLAVLIGTKVPAIHHHLFTHDYGVVNAVPFQINVSDTPRLGKSQAPVSIVEFGDFKCPTCKQWDEQILPKLESQFINPGEAKLYFKPYLIIPNSTDAASAGLSIFEQNPHAFWEYYSAIYSHQENESKNWATPRFLQTFISKYVPEVSVSRVMADISNQNELPLITASYTEAKAVHVSGTPTVYIDGYKLDDPFDYAKIVKLIKHDLGRKGA